MSAEIKASGERLLKLGQSIKAARLEFRAWDGKKMVYDDFAIRANGYVFQAGSGFENDGELYDFRGEVMQFTGLLDAKGNKIFEGDIIRIRRARRSEQTHFGENIPSPDGRYTEPLEPEIAEDVFKVEFRDGVFGILYDIENESFVPLNVAMFDCEYKTEQELREAFSGGWPRLEKEWEDDLPYLLSEYGLKNFEELMAFMGCEVIGNIHSNPELLETK